MGLVLDTPRYMGVGVVVTSKEEEEPVTQFWKAPFPYEIIFLAKRDGDCLRGSAHVTGFVGLEK